MTTGSGIAIAAVCGLVAFLAWIAPHALIGVGFFVIIMAMMILLALC